jgi:hypothetical protein
MMTTHVVSSVSGRSATSDPAPDDWTLDDVMSFDGSLLGSSQVNVVGEEEVEDKVFGIYSHRWRQLHVGPVTVIIIPVSPSVNLTTSFSTVTFADMLNPAA